MQGLLGTLKSRALAQPVPAAKRLVILYMPNCNQQGFWLPQGGLQPELGQGMANSFSFGAAYTPLEPVRKHLTMLEGLNMNVFGDQHSAGVIRFMTGGGVTGGSPGDDPTAQWALLPSIDQVLLAGSSALRSTSAGSLASLDLLADDRQETANPVYTALSWAADGKPRISDSRPHQVYDRLFAGVDLSHGDIAETLVREKSVLDYVRADLDELYRKVPASERAGLDSHLAGIRELESSIQTQLANGAEQVFPRPGELNAADSMNHPAIVSAHFNLIRSALQLDLTRVVTMGFGSSTSAVDFADIIGGSQFTEDITYSFASFGVHALAHRDEGKQSPTLQAITSWYMQKTAELIELLAATPEADGTSLLDNTLVVLFTETAEGHDHKNVPVFVFGGHKLGLTGNRCLRYQNRTTSDLWTALAPLLGAKLATFGDIEQNKGPLPGLVA